MKKLRLYQIKALHYLRQHIHAALFVEMRMGKTICIIRHIKQLSGINRVLIVAPYSALAGWREELISENYQEKEIVYLTGTKAKRLKLFNISFGRCLDVSVKWFLINKEGFLVLPEITKISWDVLILDESFIRNPQSKVTKFFCNNFRNVKHRYLLSGTPAPEGELDYFTQLYFLDPTILGFKNYWEYRLRWFAQFGYDWQIKPASRQILSQRLAKSCFFLQRNEVNLGGKQIIENRIIDLPSKFRNVYDKLEEDFILEYQSIHKQTLYAGVKFGMLHQLCGGFAEKTMVSNHKIEVLKELLGGELKGQQIVIWAWYVCEVEYLAKMLSCPGISGRIKPIDRDKFRLGFQSKKYKYIVVQPEVWKFGTTLSAASTMIYYSLPEGYLTYQQSKDRALDLEKQNSILILNLLVKDSVDEDSWESLQRKEDRTSMMRSLIRGIQKRQR
jgi:hypothetical protein